MKSEKIAGVEYTTIAKCQLEQLETKAAAYDAAKEDLELAAAVRTMLNQSGNYIVLKNPSWGNLDTFDSVEEIVAMYI